MAKSTPAEPDTPEDVAPDPLEISAKVVDNAYATVTIGSRVFDLAPDEIHRLRRVLDAAFIELPH